MLSRALPYVHPALALSLVFRSSRQRRKWVHDIVRAARPVQSEVNVVLRTPLPPRTAPRPDQERTEPGRCLPKIVNQPQDHRIGAALRGSHVVEFWPEAVTAMLGVMFGKGMLFRSAVAAGLMQLAAIEFVVPPGWQTVGLIAGLTFGKKLEPLAVIVCRPEKLPARSSFVAQSRTHRTANSRAIRSSAEKEPFIPAVKYFGNVQWPPTFAPKRDWL